MSISESKTRRVARRTGLTTVTAGLLFTGLAATQSDSASATNYSSSKANVKHAVEKATKRVEHQYSRVNARLEFSKYDFADTLMARDFTPMQLSTWQRKFTEAEKDRPGDPANPSVALLNKKKDGIWIYELRLAPEGEPQAGELQAMATHSQRKMGYNGAPRWSRHEESLAPHKETVQPTFDKVQDQKWVAARSALGSADVTVLATNAGNVERLDLRYS